MVSPSAGSFLSVLEPASGNTDAGKNSHAGHITTKGDTMKNEIHGMTVADLLAELSRLDPESVVLIQSNYGDYHNTQQLLPIEEVAEADTRNVVDNSGYSHSGWAFCEAPELEFEIDAAGYGDERIYTVLDEEGEEYGEYFTEAEAKERIIALQLGGTEEADAFAQVVILKTNC